MVSSRLCEIYGIDLFESLQASAAGFVFVGLAEQLLDMFRRHWLRSAPASSLACWRMIQRFCLVRDSGMVHCLLGIADFNALSGHPVAGASWEGFVVENLIAAAPPRTIPGFYRTAAGAEIDLLLEIPGHGLWAFEIKRGLSAKPGKGFYLACEDLKPRHRFLVNSSGERCPIAPGLEAIGVAGMAAALAAL